MSQTELPKAPAQTQTGRLMMERGGKADGVGVSRETYPSSPLQGCWLSKPPHGCNLLKYEQATGICCFPPQSEPNLENMLFLKRFISQMQPPNSVVQERWMGAICRHMAERKDRFIKIDGNTNRFPSLEQQVTGNPAHLWVHSSGT